MIVLLWKCHNQINLELSDITWANIITWIKSDILSYHQTNIYPSCIHSAMMSSLHTVYVNSNFQCCLQYGFYCSRHYCKSETFPVCQLLKLIVVFHNTCLTCVTVYTTGKPKRNFLIQLRKGEINNYIHHKKITIYYHIQGFKMSHFSQ